MSAGSQGLYESVAGKTLWPDDTVEYRLYPAQGGARDCLDKLAADCTHLARALLHGHVWNYEAFSLALWKEGREKINYSTSLSTDLINIINTGVSQPAHLFGKTCFHDNIEDEWLIVYLLFSLSKQMKELVIRYVTAGGH